jgi:hypothetical protein
VTRVRRAAGRASAWPLAIAVAVAVTACSSKPRASHGSTAGSRGAGSAAPSDPPPPVVTDLDGAAAHTGKAVVVQGTAKNAKLAAAIVSSGLVVYCLGVDGWPTDLANQPVHARGKLEQTTELATPDGGERAGTAGAVWVLRDCRYETP